MSIQPNDAGCQLIQDNYTYPQFVIDERTGHIVVNFIDGRSGRIVRHISAQKLSKVVRDHHFAREFRSGR